MFYDRQSCLKRYKQQRDTIYSEISRLENEIYSLRQCISDINEVIKILSESEEK